MTLALHDHIDGGDQECYCGKRTAQEDVVDDIIQCLKLVIRFVIHERPALSFVEDTFFLGISKDRKPGVQWLQTPLRTSYLRQYWERHEWFHPKE